MVKRNNDMSSMLYCKYACIRVCKRAGKNIKEQKDSFIFGMRNSVSTLWRSDLVTQSESMQVSTAFFFSQLTLFSPGPPYFLALSLSLMSYLALSGQLCCYGNMHLLKTFAWSHCYNTEAKNYSTSSS